MFKKLIRFDYDKSASKIEEPDHNAWKQAPAAKRPTDGSAVKPEVVKKHPIGIGQPSGVMGSVKACGGGEPAHAAMACGGGDQQMSKSTERQVAVPISAIGKPTQKVLACVPRGPPPSAPEPQTPPVGGVVVSRRRC
jgi:hypothetical protein